MPKKISDSIDVWLKFDHADWECTWSPEDTTVYCPGCEEASHEANTYMTDTGFVVEWYHNAVGLVTSVYFDTLADAYDWYEREQFQDFTS